MTHSENATAHLIDGKQTAEDIKVEIAAEVEALKTAGQKVPHLAAILVGHDGGSETYVRNKVLACERVGYNSTLLRFEDDITEAELLAQVAALNEDADIDGFIVQLPLPKHIDAEKVIEATRMWTVFTPPTWAAWWLACPRCCPLPPPVSWSSWPAKASRPAASMQW
jgi:hypothetical protein